MTAPPPNHRPYRLGYLTGDERITHTASSRQIWRQIGWHGQTGAFYALGEDPSKHEPGSFSPLWLLVDDEPPVFDDPTHHYCRSEPMTTDKIEKRDEEGQ